MSKDQTREAAAVQAAAAQMQVKWDDTNMKSSYANVCNVMSTREEVVLMFGVNQAWHAGQKEVTVQLTDRIILSPHAAQRFAFLLTKYQSSIKTVSASSTSIWLARLRASSEKHLSEQRARRHSYADGATIAEKAVIAAFLFLERRFGQTQMKTM